MKISPALLAVALVAGIAWSQEKTVSPWEVLLKHEKTLKAIPGFLDMTVAAVNGEKRIVVRVEDDRARDAVRALLGEKPEGFPVHILVSRPGLAEPGSCVHCPIHCKGPGQTVAAAPGTSAGSTSPGSTKIDMNRLDDPSYANEKCDIIRKWTGLPKRTDGEPYCIEMVSRSNDPAKVKWVLDQGLPHWRSKELPSLKGSDGTALLCPEHGNHGAETICYTWIKHRQYCPLGMKQVMKEIHDLTPTRGSRP